MGFSTAAGPSGSHDDGLSTTDEYRRWRAMIFKIRPEQAEVSQDEADRVYGVIMDIGLIDRHTSAGWAISLSAFATGEASFHPTPGGAVIGLGNDPAINRAAREIVEIAQGLLPETIAAGDLALPATGDVQFFFLTTSGTRVAEAPLDEMQRPGSPFAPLLARFAMMRRFADQVLRHKNEGLRGAPGDQRA